MSYERESIPDSVTINTNSTPTPSVMREERVISPYQGGPKPLTPAIGQSDKQREGQPEEAGKREESVTLSPQVAALARKEQRFRQQQQELERDRAAIAADKTEMEQLRALKAKITAKDYSALDDLVDYNEYSQYKVNKLNGADPVQEEIKKLNGKISDIEKQAQENVSKQFEAAVNERRIAAKALDQTDQFPRIKKAQAHEAVVQHILDTWEHDSQELSVEQAAKEVEELLVERAKQWASLLEDQEVAPDAAPAEKKVLPPMKQGMKTLTNQMNAGDIRPAKSLQHMSDSERWAEARRRAEDKLRSR